jgi:hypothetical protein
LKLGFKPKVLKMDSAPPPYTRAPLEARSMDEAAMKNLMQRFLIDSIAFAYRVDDTVLKNALSLTDFIIREPSPAPKSSEAPLSIKRRSQNPVSRLIAYIPNTKHHNFSKAAAPSILSQDDREDILYLATTASDVHKKIKTHSISLIAESQINLLHECVYRAAYNLKVHPVYALKLLYLYSKHEGIDRKIAGHYIGKVWLLGYCLDSPSDIAQRLISDDLLVELVAPNEQTRLLLGGGVEKFSRKRRVEHYKAVLIRGFYAAKEFTATMEYVVHQVHELRKG